MKPRTLLLPLLAALLAFTIGTPLPLFGQSTPLIKELESKRIDLRQRINDSESLLRTAKKNVGSQLGGLASLTGQIEQRKRFILALNNDMERIDRQLAAQERLLNRLQRDLKDKKKKYAASVRYLYDNRSIEAKLLFILSARTLAQSYRRLRYVREYADYQRQQGEEVLAKQKEVDRQRTELQKTRRAKLELLSAREEEKTKLEAQEKEQRTLVTSLQKKQRSIQQELNRQRKEAAQLNDRIDRLIADEIEKSRRRATAEARKEAKKPAKPSTSKSTKEGTVDAYTLTKADRTLSSDFASNRGKLPMPITGPYIITGHYGVRTVEGLRAVRLDSKGIDIQGRPGAQARAIFGGRVTAVFRLNGLFNILIRHGSYISVYCNLSTTSVKQGDDVTTKQVLGTIFSDRTDNGRTVLHFQLRREQEKFNPEPWLNR
jgi:septal ring factor EnvC (AmiA/AmiB activator)